MNWSFTYQCRMSSFTRALSLPSSSASLSCAVATYSAEVPPRMHQNSPFSDKKFSGERAQPPKTPRTPNFKTVVVPLNTWAKLNDANVIFFVLRKNASENFDDFCMDITFHLHPLRSVKLILLVRQQGLLMSITAKCVLYKWILQAHCSKHFAHQRHKNVASFVELNTWPQHARLKYGASLPKQTVWRLNQLKQVIVLERHALPVGTTAIHW